MSGLSGELILRNNGGDDLHITASGAWAFGQLIESNTGYAVTVLQQPASQQCSVTNGSGIVGESDVLVTVACTTAFALNVAVTGVLNNFSNSVVVQNNVSVPVTLRQSGSNLVGKFAPGTSYSLRVLEHPSYPAGNCAFTGPASGTLVDRDVTVQMVCAPLPKPTLTAEMDVTDVSRVTLKWGSSAAEAGYNLYVSTLRACDFTRADFTSCPAEKRLSVTEGAGYVIREFNNQLFSKNQPYYFQIEVMHGNGSRDLSNLVAARVARPAFNGDIRAFTTAPDGTLYVGGKFNSVGFTTGSGVPLNEATGKFAMGDFPEVAGTVYAAIADGHGGWFIGGSFAVVGGMRRQNLAHILADYTVDPNFDQRLDGTVFAMVINGGTLYVGGKFQSVSGVSLRNLVAINLTAPNYDLLPWDPNPDDAVHALATSFRSLFVGGFFREAGKPAYFRIYETADRALGDPVSAQPKPVDMNVDDPVYSMSPGATYVGGAFHRFGNQPRLGIAKLDQLQPGAPPTLNPNFHPALYGFYQVQQTVRAIAVSPRNDVVYIGGFFAVTDASGTERRYLAAVSADTGQVLPFAPTPDAEVSALAISGSGDASSPLTIFAGGSFSSIGSSSARLDQAGGFAALTAGGEVRPAFALHPGSAKWSRGSVFALSSLNGVLYIGGDFNSVNATPRANLAALRSDGSLLPWNPGTDGQVNALLYHDNRYRGPVVYVGGQFFTIGGVDKQSLAAVNSMTGAVLVADANGPTFEGVTDGFVNSLALIDDPQATTPIEALYVGGFFSSVGGSSQSPVNSLAKLYFFNGTIDLSFKPEPRRGSATRTDIRTVLAVVNDDATHTDVLYVGGDFDRLDPAHMTACSSIKNLAKLSAGTGTAIAFGCTAAADGPVSALALSSDRRTVYIGGELTGRDDRPGRFRALDVTGRLIGTFGPFAPRLPQYVPEYALAVAPNGVFSGTDTVFAGGTFASIGSTSIPFFAALRGVLGLVPTANASQGVAVANGPVRAFARVGNTLYMGGDFTGFQPPLDNSAPGAVRGNFAAIDVTTGRLQ